MSEHLQTSEENTKTIIESYQQLTKTLAEIQPDTSKKTIDPNSSQLRQKLSDYLQRENCVITITGCTEVQDGKPGMLALMDKLKSRNGFEI